MGETDGRSDGQGRWTRVFWTVTSVQRSRSQTKVGWAPRPPTSHWWMGEEKVMKETQGLHMVPGTCLPGKTALSIVNKHIKVNTQHGLVRRFLQVFL